MLTRRALLALGTAAVAAFALRVPAFAQAGGAATNFVQTFGAQLIGVVNGPGDLAEKQTAIQPLIDHAVDVNGIAVFCLGRFAHSATPAQTSEFTRLFHAVLVKNITSRIGEYKGVTFRTTNTTQRGGEALVGTLVQRPNNAPNNVQWVVTEIDGAPKIVDVVAEGTSLRLTQRSDYASFLSQHGNNVEALLAAMKRQVES